MGICYIASFKQEDDGTVDFMQNTTLRLQIFLLIC